MTDFAINSDGPRMFFLSGELDMSTAPLMETAIAPAIAKGGPVTLDLSELVFIDSSGVGSIVRSLNALPSGCILLHGVRNAPKRVLEIMGVDQASTNLHIIPCTVPVRAVAV
ncbi:MAG: STAS domain-containing protein [Actinobacteria bacterium]|nr:MAG: STAS domain-containing protein [Actinomycetota bacterium]